MEQTKQTTKSPVVREYKIGDITYIVTFRYSDSNTIRLEIYQNNLALVNELLARSSDKLIGGP